MKKKFFVLAILDGGVVQFKVPQNIDLEDKIIGPLTLIQFVYLMIGGAVFYIMFKAGNTTLLVFVGIPAALLAVFLAFVKINDQPFSRFVVSLLSYMARPKERVWHKQLELEGTPEIKVAPKAVKKTAKPIARAIEKSDLEKLSQIMDTKGWSGIKTSPDKNTVVGQQKQSEVKVS